MPEFEYRNFSILKVHSISLFTTKTTAMNKLLICTMAIGLLVGCRSKQTFTSDDGKESVTVDVTKMQDAAEDMNKKVEELKKLPPLKIDELKAMLPEELMGMKRSNFNASSMAGYGTAEATYTKDDTTSIRLNIFDCVGDAGSAVYMMSYWTKMSMESQNDDGYTKTVDFNGGKAVEDFKKNNNSYTLTFTANDRLLVTIQGQNVPLSTVQDVAKKLNLKTSS